MSAIVQYVVLFANLSLNCLSYVIRPLLCFNPLKFLLSFLFMLYCFIYFALYFVFCDLYCFSLNILLFLPFVH
jgi:hypothetical protein